MIYTFRITNWIDGSEIIQEVVAADGEEASLWLTKNHPTADYYFVALRKEPELDDKNTDKNTCESERVKILAKANQAIEAKIDELKKSRLASLEDKDYEAVLRFDGTITGLELAKSINLTQAFE